MELQGAMGDAMPPHPAATDVIPGGHPGIGEAPSETQSHPCVPPPPQGKRKADSLGGRGRRSQLAGLVLVKKAKMDSAGQAAPSPGAKASEPGSREAAPSPGNPVNGKTAELTAPAPSGGTSSLSLLGAYTDSEDSS